MAGIIRRLVSRSVPSRTEPDDAVVVDDVTSFSALDVVDTRPTVWCYKELKDTDALGAVRAALSILPNFEENNHCVLAVV